MLLTSRKLLQRKLLDVESDLRGTLRNFGLKVGVVSSGRYEARVRELVAGHPAEDEGCATRISVSNSRIHCHERHHALSNCLRFANARNR